MLDHTPLSDIIQALASGRVSATALTKAYLARIAAYDRAGPMLNAVRELNPDALTIAGKLDTPSRRSNGRWPVSRFW